MRTWWATLWLIAASLLLAGCATSTVRSSVTSFHELPTQWQQKTYVFERTKEQDNSLEYRTYEDLVRAELNRLGLREASSASPPELIVSFSYGIDARDVRVSEPVLVDPYWYGPAWRGFYGPGFYSPFYDPFWYAPPIVERRESNYRVFTRRLRIVMLRASDRKTVYESTVVSEGGNGALAAVMPYLVRSAFTDFPGQNGATRVVELAVDSR